METEQLSINSIDKRYCFNGFDFINEPVQTLPLFLILFLFLFFYSSNDFGFLRNESMIKKTFFLKYPNNIKKKHKKTISIKILLKISNLLDKYSGSHVRTSKIYFISHLFDIFNHKIM